MIKKIHFEKHESEYKDYREELRCRTRDIVDLNKKIELILKNENFSINTTINDSEKKSLIQELNNITCKIIEIKKIANETLPKKSNKVCFSYLKGKVLINPIFVSKTELLSTFIRKYQMQVKILFSKRKELSKAISMLIEQNIINEKRKRVDSDEEINSSDDGNYSIEVNSDDSSEEESVIRKFKRIKIVDEKKPRKCYDLFSDLNIDED